MNVKLIALIVLLIVMVGLAWNIERTARPVPDREAAAAAGGESHEGHNH